VARHNDYSFAMKDGSAATRTTQLGQRRREDLLNEGLTELLAQWFGSSLPLDPTYK
jgi:hypothetical protein